MFVLTKRDLGGTAKEFSITSVLSGLYGSQFTEWICLSDFVSVWNPVLIALLNTFGFRSQGL